VLTVIVYLLAACAANVGVTVFGQAALPVTAFVLIPFDLTARDLLHDRWQGNHVLIRMCLLVAVGSFLSWLACSGSARIAISSAISFAIAGVVDTVVYQIARIKNRKVKVNVSNLASSTADSLVFPLLAFGSLSAMIFVTQLSSKFFGGLLWSHLLIRKKANEQH